MASMIEEAGKCSSFNIRMKCRYGRRSREKLLISFKSVELGVLAKLAISFGKAFAGRRRTTIRQLPGQGRFARQKTSKPFVMQ